MSGFELDTRGADEIDERALEGGVPFMSGGPSFFEGTPTAGAKGLARGTVAKGALLIGDAATPVLKPVAKTVDKLIGTGLDAWLDEQQRRSRQAMEDLRPDPHTTGFAAQVLGSFLDIGSSAALFTPEGAAILEGYSRKQELETQGVGPNVAAAGGAVSGLATLVGVKAPLTLGRTAVGQGPISVARNMGYGAAANISAGVAERGTMRELLERTGFKDQAKLFAPYDEEAMLAEGVVGALFSGGAVALELRGSQKGQRAIDAAMTSKAAKHRAIEVAPGVPADSRSTAAHADAMDMATSQALRNEPVMVGDALADATFVRPINQLGRDVVDELKLHVADLLPDPASSVPVRASRGIRSNNPGNIRATGEQWQGQIGSDGGFVTFATPQAGIRALAKILLNYQDVHGLNTIEGLVNRWAPPEDKGNDTKAYVKAVADAIGFKPTTSLNLRDPEVLRRVATAVVHHENGTQPYPDALIRAGVDEALSGRTLGVRADVPGAHGRLPQSPEAKSSTMQEGAARTGTDVQESNSAPLAGDLVKYENSTLFGAGRSIPDPSTALGTSPVLASSERFPRAANLEPIAVGPTLVEPHEIATGRQLYRETSIQGLGDLLMHDLRAHVRQLFVTDSPSLAISQGENKGVHVVFREGALSGAEHRKPGTSDATGREYRADMLAPRAIESFTVPADFTSQALRGSARRALAEFDAVPQPDGSVRYTRKPSAGDAGSSSPLPAQGRTEPVWASNDQAKPATPTHTLDGAVLAGQRRDQTLAAAAEVAAERPDMLVALDDGTEIPAADLLARVETERAQAEQDAKAFQAAANCFLRS